MSSRFTDTTITMQYFIPEPPQMLVLVELTPAHTHLHSALPLALPRGHPALSPASAH